MPLYSGKAIHANRVERIQTILVSKGLSLYQISQQWQSEAQTFIRKEEERPVLQDRPAKVASKIILPFSWLRLAGVVGEPIIGIESIVSQVITKRFP